MLEVDIREKRFDSSDGGALVAVRDLSFAVAPSEFVCLIGPSGCGKTTTLRMILGLDDRYEGEVRLADRDGRIAVVFQEPRLLPWRTVEQNVRLAMPKAERRRDLDELFAILGLDGMRALYPGELSLGLARRAAMARAFALAPSLLLLDEPFVSLDGETAARLRDLLLAVWRARPTTVLMVTHNLREAAALADRVVILSDRPGTVRGIVPLTGEKGRRSAAAVSAAVAEIERVFAGAS